MTDRPTAHLPAPCLAILVLVWVAVIATVVYVLAPGPLG